jgi:hypothetical protein
MQAETWQKEQISVALLHAIATREGMTVTRWAVDKDGVDATVRKRGPMVDIQLKCTQAARQISSGYSFDLDVATYDKLRSADNSAPGYLVLVVIPPDIGHCIVHDEEQLLLRCKGFYARIQDRPAAKGRTKVAIHLSEDDRFDGKALVAMVEYSRRRVLSAHVGDSI